jgi:hypothetical protein
MSSKAQIYSSVEKKPVTRIADWRGRTLHRVGDRRFGRLAAIYGIPLLLNVGVCVANPLSSLPVLILVVLIVAFLVFALAVVVLSMIVTIERVAAVMSERRLMNEHCAARYHGLWDKWIDGIS